MIHRDPDPDDINEHIARDDEAKRAGILEERERIASWLAGARDSIRVIERDHDESRDSSTTLTLRLARAIREGEHLR